MTQSTESSITLSGQSASRVPRVDPILGERRLFGPTGSAWISEVKVALSSMLALDDDWDSYGGAAPRAEIVQSALGLLQLLAREGCRSPTLLSPTAIGGVYVEWRAGTHELEVNFVSRHSASYVYEDKSTEKIVSGAIFTDDRDGGVFLSLMRDHFTA